ncbi:MAG: hypothetical protein AB8G11_10890 [Saprospiraceae bacterium]
MQLSKQHWVYIIVTLGFLSQIFLSQSLWYDANRHFFLIPMFDVLPLNIGDIGNMFLFIGLLVSLIIGLFYFKKQLLIPIILLVAILFLQDITRVQAWSYQYFLTFLVLLIDWNKPIEKRLPTLQWILIFTYFWSGIQKFNPHYVEVVHPWLFSAFEWSKPFAEIGNWAYWTAAFETLVGIGLIFQRTRKVAIITGLGMHFFILLMIGPWGEDWNSVVYPWNVVMMCLLVVLFFRKPINAEKEITLLKKPNAAMQWFIIIVLGILPIFNIFTRFPETISMTMYNGATSELSVYFDENETPSCIPNTATEAIYQTRNGYQISLDDWGVEELNVPIYDLPTYAKKFGKQFCDCVQNKKNAGIKITNVKRWTREDYVILERFDCNALK